MRLYEGMFLVDSREAAKDWDDLVNHINGLITRYGGEIVKGERWRDRKMAYEAAGVSRGTYYLLYFNAKPSAIEEIRRDVKISERIVRALLLVREESMDEIDRINARIKAQAAEEGAEGVVGVGVPVGAGSDRRHE